MKVIIINDSDGHINAVAYTDKNMRSLLQALVECGDCHDKDGAKEMIDSGDFANDIEGFIRENCHPGRAGGSRFDIIETKDWNFRVNPLE